VTDAREVIAIARFRGGPGREAEAAMAWSFELKYYFHRGINPDQPPQVTYEDGVYTCTGTMVTTHPGDRAITIFDEDADPWDLDFAAGTSRKADLRRLYHDSPLPHWDGGFPG
jgi:hypothetical protein